jgi:thiamine pyrophosphate-dependent acetolactate synthase large subunit-like protein
VTALDPRPLDRRHVVKTLVADRRDLLVVAGLGSTAYDLFAAGDHPANFYLWGAMGGAAMIGLGLALAQPHRPVLVVTGDGEQLMGLGSFATIGAQQPANLGLAVIDNERYGETGMQRSHTALGTDLVAVAKACGIAWARDIQGEAELGAFVAQMRRMAAPSFALIKVAPENPPRVLPPRDGVHLKNRFRQALGFDVN